ncbi:RDD family protein, partial [uncultured Propionibacterium sp.]|uniref:RDD family protein n=1 Tax=uncultured Propionibacterium sp. TaxID=218066 RepID=UPI00292FD0F3
APGAHGQPGYGQQQPPYGQARPGYGPQQGGYPYQGGYQQNPWRSQAGFAYPTGPATADGVRLGGWGARLVAWIIDGILLGVVQAVVLQVFFSDIIDALMSWQRDVVSAISAGSVNYPSGPADPSYGVTTQWYVYQAITIVIGFAYFVLMMRSRGASLGQQAMGLRVVPAEQGRAPAGLPWGTTCIRNVVWYGARLLGMLPVIGILAGLFQVVDIVYGLVNKRRRTLHDRIAGTQVVSTRP